MGTLYVILASAGWIWLVLLFGYLGLRSRRTEPQGFDVRLPEQKD